MLSGYERILGQGLGVETEALLDITFTPTADSCIIVPYVFRTSQYFKEMPVYRLIISNQADTLKTEFLDQIFNRTSMLRGVVHVPITSGTHNVRVEAFVSSEAEIGLDDVTLQTGACPFDGGLFFSYIVIFSHIC